jgi:hypothetical protein
MRIFISHGTDKSNPAELDFLDELERQLRVADPGGTTHEVLLDRTRLEAGDEWAGVLHDWLAECQVAIVLLSRRALDRPWVQKEATILSFRRQRDAAFPFIPLLLPGLDAADLAAHPVFSALKLDAVQTFPSGVQGAAVAAFVKNRLASIQVPQTTPLDRLQQVLENWICDANAAALEQACNDWLGEPVSWSSDIDRARQRARVIARVIARGRPGPSVTLPRMAKALTGAALTRERTLRVLDLASSLWVDEEVAARLRAVMDCRTRTPVAAALNSGRIEYGAKMAVWRSLLPDLAGDVYCVAGAASDGRGDELVDAIHRAYMEGNKDDVADEEEAAAMLAAREEPVFFVIPPPVPDQALLADLHQRFPSAIFIAHTGTSLPVGLGPHIATLTPGLQLDLELRYKSDYAAAKKIP